MTPHLLVLRPEPGAAATVKRAAARGLVAVAAPMFAVAQVEWTPPAADGFDAIMLTSANALRHAGPALAYYRAVPAYAVGEATRAATMTAGFDDVVAGDDNAEALLARISADGRRRVLHPCGRDHKPVAGTDIRVVQVVVYEAVPVTKLDAAAVAALADGAIALLHSPAAAALFARLLAEAGLERSALSIAAISYATGEAAGVGWAALAIAARPTDDALLAAAARLCEGSRRLW